MYPTTTKRIIRLDPSSLELYSCPRKFQLSNRFGYVPKHGAPPLDFGQALHKAIAAWRIDRVRGCETDARKYIDIGTQYYAACMCAKAEHRSLDNLFAVLRDYFKWYRVDPFQPLLLSNGDVGVELSFSRRVYENEHTIVYLCGVIDGLGFYDGNTLTLLDTKHSSSTKIEAHLEEQQARPQFHIYSWVVREEQLVSHYVPIVIDGVYISKKYSGAKLQRAGPYVIPDHLIERTMSRVMHVAREIAETPDDVEWRYNYSECHGKYSLCQYYNICQVDAESQAMPLKYQFSQREYNPAKFGE